MATSRDNEEGGARRDPVEIELEEWWLKGEKSRWAMVKEKVHLTWEPETRGDFQVPHFFVFSVSK